MDEKQKQDGIEFAMEQAKQFGYAVITVNDGWMFIFTEATLASLAAQAKGTGKVIIHVQSSEKKAQDPKNLQ